MRIVLVSLVCFAVFPVMSAEEGAPTTARQKSLLKLTESFSYQPPPAKTAEASSPPAEDVVVMDRFVVSEPLVPRGLPDRMERDRQKRKEEQFSPIRGGRLFRAGPFEVGSWGASSGVSFLRVAW